MTPDPLANALSIRADLRSKLRAVENFISTYQAFAAGKFQQPARRETIRGRPADAWRQIKAALATAYPAPMTRGEIVKSCAENGYTMPGAKPLDYVGIIIFRHKDEVETNNGRYRLRTETAQHEMHEPAPTVNETRD